MAAVLQPADEHRVLFEVCWDLLSRRFPLVVANADELAECLTDRPSFGSAEAVGWGTGALGASLVYPSNDPFTDPKLRALEDEVIEALGPDAVWYANGDHPLPAFLRHGSGRGWRPILDATADLVVGARGNGLDLVLARAEED